MPLYENRTNLFLENISKNLLLRVSSSPNLSYKGADLAFTELRRFPYQTTAIAMLLTDRATIASQALFGKTCFFAFK
jgi:hypothetical protein